LKALNIDETHAAIPVHELRKKLESLKAIPLKRNGENGQLSLNLRPRASRKPAAVKKSAQPKKTKTRAVKKSGAAATKKQKPAAVKKSAPPKKAKTAAGKKHLPKAQGKNSPRKKAKQERKHAPERKSMKTNKVSATLLERPASPENAVAASLESMISSTLTSAPLPEKSKSSPRREIKSMPEHLGFERHPFGDSLDTSFFYKSENHEFALIKMLMSIENDISFGLVYGHSGTGKTLVSQAVLEKLARDRYLPILVPVTPGLSKTAFLNILLREFGYDENGKTLRDVNAMVGILGDYILSYYKKGIKPVLLIDECHFLSSQALHILRTLSNFEAFNKKLITCLLFAEEKFMRRLSNPSYASLRNRIYLEVELAPLSIEECLNYIKFRLMIAGNKKGDFFSDSELSRIYAKSRGIPRNVNKECTRIMLERFLSKRT
jgi:type II secretory pathway predicted ATPase ExeA